MRRSWYPALVGTAALAAATIVGAAAGSAAASPTTQQSSRCPGVAVAPMSMNPIPADANCDVTASTGEQSAVAGSATTASTPIAPTTPIAATPLAFDTTNGDILAITRVIGATTASVAIGGNFTAVITPDGRSHAAKNFAIVNEKTGAIIYAGKANSYVRAIASYDGTVYVGGDFTSFGGVARAHITALNPKNTVTAWNPGSSSPIRAIAADASGIYYGGDEAYVQKVNSTTGAVVWRQAITGGGIKAMQLTPDGASLFVGGLFETYGSLTRHGLIKALTSSGEPVTAFNAHLRADSGTGQIGAFDGEEAISFALTTEGTNLVVGLGGHGSDEVRKINLTTGAQVWNAVLVGDCQAVVTVGDTFVVGYHRNIPNPSVLPPYPYFSAQLEGSNDALTTFDAKITGAQGNVDGGNNGVQAAYADPATKTLFLAGGFTMYNGVAGHQSLIAFTYA